MEEYTKEDVLEALSKIIIKSRKRVLVDQRSYLIGILAYRFMLSEHTIAKLTGHKRHTVNYNKKLAIDFCKDKSYMQNVYVYAQMFPFDFSVIEKESKSERSVRVELDLDKKLFNKLKAVGAIKGQSDIRVIIKFFLEKSLTIWDE
jgi:hypothetical protein